MSPRFRPPGTGGPPHTAIPAYRTGSPGTVSTSPSRISLRRCAAASATAMFRESNGIRSQGRFHSIRSAVSQTVSGSPSRTSSPRSLRAWWSSSSRTRPAAPVKVCSCAGSTSAGASRATRSSERR